MPCRPRRLARPPSPPISQVNMARVFNWDVKNRRKIKEAAEKEAEGGK